MTYDNRTLVWGELKAEPGQFVTGMVKVAELSHRGPVLMPVLIVNGAKPGPRLWLNGAVHGDELNGPMAIRNLLPALEPEKLSGAIIATPISNPLAFQARQKNTPQDSLDLDMQFPGDPNGTLSQRLAHLLFERIKEMATHLIDCHTLGTHFQALPYTVFKRIPAASSEISDQAERMARAFGATAHCRVDLGGSLNELPGNVSGFLDVQCQIHGIPAFMAELGWGGVLQPEIVSFSERGFLAVLHDLEMWPEAPDPAPYTAPRTITRRRFLYTDHGGLCIDGAAPGTVVRAGERVCRIVDMFGTVQEIIADEDMYIIASRQNPPVDTGDRVAFVGLAWEQEEDIDE
ncbi:M14 family metallopeptidase [Paenibacillus senegalensis]|uniref:M14 family metallopeptidase n=1 Tax=Paenibacillus senegalensis TaxID=1465766 RepID=UPI000287F1F4|nr:M14 family metallopeptidase [Paenibacillus senegalensis]